LAYISAAESIGVSTPIRNPHQKLPDSVKLLGR